MKESKKMDYKKYFCPVCMQSFKEDDDVVVCPDCGTAHHRSCWLENGHCFNEEKHNSEENLKELFLNEKEAEPEKNTVDEPVERVQAELVDNGLKDKKYNEEFGHNPSQSFLIVGREAFYYQIAVRKNQKYYIPTFMAISQTKGKAISWNIAGFFVPFAWSLYRKMYKITALILAVYMLIAGISVYFVSQNEALFEIGEICYQEDANFAQNILSAQMGEDVTLTKNQQKFIEEMNKQTIPTGVSTFCTILLYASKFIIAFKSNKLYMKEIDKKIRKAEQIGLSVEQTKVYLYKKMGTLPFALMFIVGLFEWSMFS